MSIYGRRRDQWGKSLPPDGGIALKTARFSSCLESDARFELFSYCYFTSSIIFMQLYGPIHCFYSFEFAPRTRRVFKTVP